MDEYINVDGNLYKLSVTQPLTWDQRNQAAEQIRNGQLRTLSNTGTVQTAGSSCASGRCGSGQAVNVNWNYNVPNMQSLVGPATAATAATCRTSAGSGDTITLSAYPNGGIAPYTVHFHREVAAGTNAGIFTLVTYSGQAEATTTSTTYTITDIDVAGSTGATGTTMTVGGATVAVPSLAAGYIRFLTSITDACTGTGAPGYCVEYCDVALVCVAPTCNFVVA